MASGSFEFATGNNYITGRIQWSSSSNGSSANSSNVSATLSFKKSSSSTAATYGNFSGSVSIDGASSSFNSRITLNPNNSWVTIGTANKLVNHNSDGSKSIWISSTGGISGLTFNYSNKGGTATLDNIPRASTVSSFSAPIESTYKIQIHSQSSNFVHKLYYTFGSDDWIEIASNVRTSYDWVIPTDIYSKLPNSNSGQGRIICETYNSYVAQNTFIGDFGTTFTARVTHSNPTVGTYTYADTNSTTTAITEDSQRIIRNKSNLVFTMGTATAKNSATISKYEVTFNGVTKSRTTAGTFDFGTVNVAQNAQATFTVTDSRGNTATKTKTVIIDDWEIPTGLIICQRKSNYYSDTMIKVSSKYSSLNNKNTLTIQCQYKKISDTAYSSTQTLEDNTETTLVLDNLYQWNVRVYVTDRLGTTIYNLVVDKGIPILFIDRNLRSIGVNCFPTKSSSIESQGLQLDDLIYMGSQELYPSFSTSEVGTTSLLGAYDYRLINGIFTGITIPTGYERAYRLTAQVQTTNENKVTVYINNIGTAAVGTWSAPTFRNILASRIFKESEITLEATYGYTQKQGTNLKVSNSASYLCNVYAITLHAYLVKSDTNIVVTIADTTPTNPA